MIKFLLVFCAVFSVVELANASTAQWDFEGDWVGEKGCIVEVRVTPSQVKKYTYVFSFVMYKSAADKDKGEVWRSFASESLPADSAQDSINQTFDSKQDLCLKGENCEFTWLDDRKVARSRGQCVYPAEVFVKFDKDLVLTSVGMFQTDRFDQSTKTCKNLAKK